MRTFLHHLQNVNESFEVASLRGSQWTFFEERHHDVDEVAPALHGEAHELLAVIVAAVVLDDVAAPEHLDGGVRARRPGARCLGDRELVLDLPAESTPRVADYRYREATFAVDEADGPLLDAWPFLLIDRTGRIFTAHARTV